MGLDDAIRSRTVEEEGIAFVDSSGKHLAEFRSRPDGASFTSDIEILRGDLAAVFLEATENNVEYLWGDYITGLDEQDDGIVAKFSRAEQRKVDLVVAADGMHSKTRKLVFDDSGALYHLGQYMAYFTIPVSERDSSWATWYNAPGGRLILVRPDLKRQRTGAYLAVCNNEHPKEYLGRGVPDQMKMWDDLFKDAGGDAERVIKGMYTADDFYMQQIAQVKMPQWSKGRVALLGDAAFCPSPISGVGTACAIEGAYILAGELTKHNDYKAGFAGYEKMMRPVIAKAQRLIPGTPALANPQTSWGISIMNGILSVVSWTGITNWLQGAVLNELVDLPEYQM
ncbi:Monooxygenase FAD-binding protein [Macrophomina phaseolina MS6]|uniref:Monooxygenase FAD-binding protein n=1 Tax=Macrophomina phaseolina (strain MS6) TaxID=1126212 RepID=K2RVT9_MACPH|nr:Monooxygenase FAD-binding protein [Macrophomina phaseolina MS6]